jgi:hypothetical protein
VIGDPNEIVMSRIKAFYYTIAAMIEKERGLMAVPTINLTNEGFGRALITVGELVVMDRRLRDVHRFRPCVHLRLPRDRRTPWCAVRNSRRFLRRARFVPWRRPSESSGSPGLGTRKSAVPGFVDFATIALCRPCRLRNRKRRLFFCQTQKNNRIERFLSSGTWFALIYVKLENPNATNSRGCGKSFSA